MTAALWIFGLIVVVFGFVVFRGAPYVPSRRRDIRVAFESLYPVGSNDLLVDIGSGDGVVLRMAAARGARALGYELNPILVWVSRWLSRKSPHVEIMLADFWRAALPAETTVVYTFGDSRDIRKMANKVQREATRLGKPLFFISYAFAVPGLTPTKTEEPYFLYRLDPLHRAQA